MQHVHRPRVPQRVDSAKCIATKILNHLHDPCPAKASHCFRVVVLTAALRDVQCITHVILDRTGELAQIIEALDAIQMIGFKFGTQQLALRLQYSDFTICRQGEESVLQFSALSGNGVEFGRGLASNENLLATTCVVAASTAALPTITGYGTDLFQIVVLGAFAFTGAITSFDYADKHHAPVYAVALVLNLMLFLMPAIAICLVGRERWPNWCSVAIVAWCGFYMASLFWLFPATDGP